MTEELGEFRHFYLYAKGWYKTSFVRQDLIKIAAAITGIPEHLVRVSDIKNILIQLVWKEINRSGNPENAFRSFVIGDPWDSKDEFLPFLKVLQLCKRSLKELGPPDGTILPFWTDRKRGEWVGGAGSEEFAQELMEKYTAKGELSAHHID